MKPVIADSLEPLWQDMLDHASDEFETGVGLQNVFEAEITCLHEWAEQIAIAIEPGVKEIWHGQYDVPVCYTGYESSSDVVCPSVSVDLGTRQAKARFACEGNASGFSTRRAKVLYKAHLFRVATVQHFLHCLVVFCAVVARMDLLELIPLVLKNTLKGFLVNAFRGSSSTDDHSRMGIKIEKKLLYTRF